MRWPRQLVKGKFYLGLKVPQGAHYHGKEHNSRQAGMSLMDRLRAHILIHEQSESTLGIKRDF